MTERFECEVDNELPIKRFCFPLVITTKCPKCGTECERDFSDQYLSYPDPKHDKELDWYCDDGDECYHEWTTPMKLEILISIEIG